MTEPRKRDAMATREAILTAARAVFTEKGYDSAGIRQIADRAQVNVALINRYFGSKEGLFVLAVPPALSLDAAMTGDMASFGTRIAAVMAHKVPTGDFDPIIALLRAASSHDAVPILRQALNAQVTLPLAARLHADHPFERAALIGATILGFDLVTRVLGLTQSADLAALEQTLATSLQRLVDP